MRTTLTCAAAVLLGTALAACTTAPVDSASDQPASLQITYTFSGFTPEATDCQLAWAESLWVEIEDARGGVSVLSQPCDNDPVLLEQLVAGASVVTVRTVVDGDAATGVWATSAPQQVDLLGAQVTELTVDIACQANCTE